MKKLFLLGFLGYGLLTGVFAQSSTDAPPPPPPPLSGKGQIEVTPEKIDVPATVTNPVSPQHVNIPGTKVYLVPPDGYAVSTVGSTGLVKENEGTIQVFDMPGTSFEANAASFNEAGFAAQNSPISCYKELTINELSARLVCLPGAENRNNYSILFGDETFSVIIVASYINDNPAKGEALKKSILSVVYKKEEVLNPLANAKFTLDTSQSRFKFAKTFANGYFYSVDGVDTFGSNKHPFLMVMTFPLNEDNNPESGKEIARGFRDSFLKRGVELETTSESLDRVNGYIAYECEMRQENKKKGMVVYMLALMHNNMTFVLQGIVPNATGESLAELKKLAHTIRIK